MDECRGMDAEGWIERDGCTRMDVKGWMQRGGCRGMDGWMQWEGCTGMDGLHPALLSPQSLTSPAAVPSHGRLSKGENQHPVEGWQSSATQSQSLCQACATAPSDSARSASEPFPPATAPQLPGEAPSDTAGRFQSLWRERASRYESPFPMGHLESQGCLP